jgi:hypothetical protein
MDCSQKRCGIFCISGCDPTPTLQMKESIFNQVTCFIKLLVILSLFFSVLLWRNYRHHPQICRLEKDFVGVVTSVRQQMLSRKTVNQGYCLLTICCCTLCNNSPDRHTMRIHGQMQFWVEPPFVRLMSWLPPLAPVAWGCTLQWLASIMSHLKSGSSIKVSSSRSHTPLSRQRMKRRCVLLQPPKSGGRSRHGAPVRMTQKTALMKRRLSCAIPPQVPSRPGRSGSSFFQTASEMSCRLCATGCIGPRLWLMTSELCHNFKI